MMQVSLFISLLLILITYGVSDFVRVYMATVMNKTVINKLVSQKKYSNHEKTNQNTSKYIKSV